ncbi:MAG: response regulator [Candidatus Lambdaproteobacteria bacterium]|nr:response regulator [Candidatus Lambdaproteobacteria bacterium]
MSGKTVVIIDDSSVMRSILRKAILMTGLKVEQFLEAANGNEGMTRIRDHLDELDIVFTDLDMPECTGVQMMTRLREEGIAGFPIVIVSTVGNKKMQETCHALGAVAFLEKPFKQEEIGTLLTSLLA